MRGLVFFILLIIFGSLIEFLVCFNSIFYDNSILGKVIWFNCISLMPIYLLDGIKLWNTYCDKTIESLKNLENLTSLNSENKTSPIHFNESIEVCIKLDDDLDINIEESKQSDDLNIRNSLDTGINCIDIYKDQAKLKIMDFLKGFPDTFDRNPSIKEGIRSESDNSIDSISDKISSNDFKYSMIKPEPVSKKFKRSKEIIVRDNTTLSNKNNSLKEIGDIGELLALKAERDRLVSLKMNIGEYPQLVSLKRGIGYDILSIDNHNNLLFCEVKSTVDDFYSSIIMTRSEFNSLRKNPLSYFIYRIYNLNLKEKSANICLLKGFTEIESYFDFYPKSYLLKYKEIESV